MNKLPTAKGVPFKKIREKFAELFAYLKRVQPIPGGLLEITPSGFKVKSPLQKIHRPQFNPTCVRAYDSAGGIDPSGTKLFINTGYVFGPWDYDGSDSDRLNALNQFPFEPTINSTLLSADDKPSLTLEPGYTNFILLKIEWGERTDVIGKRGAGGSFHIAPSLLVNSEVVIDGTTHAVSITSSDSSSHDGITLSLSEINYYVKGVTIVSQTSENMPRENGAFTYVLAGYYTLDSYGIPTDTRWFLEGPVWAHNHPRIVDASTGDSDRTEPPAPIDPDGIGLSDLHDIPGYVETG